MTTAPKLSDLNPDARIDGLTLSEYCDDVDQVRRDAEAADVKGEPHRHYHSHKGQYTGKITTKFRPLNNADLYNFAKTRYASAQAAREASGRTGSPGLVGKS